MPLVSFPGPSYRLPWRLKPEVARSTTRRAINLTRQADDINVDARNHPAGEALRSGSVEMFGGRAGGRSQPNGIDLEQEPAEATSDRRYVDLIVGAAKRYTVHRWAGLRHVCRA